MRRKSQLKALGNGGLFLSPSLARIGGPTATLSIDFDGVIRDMKTNKPIEGAQSALRKLKNEDNHIIVIHSCNSPKFIEQWMNDNDIPFHVIAREKPVADLYLDDHGVRFHGWNLFLASLPWNLPIDQGGKPNR